MKKIFFLIFMISLSFSVFCDQADFINKLLEKEQATFEDCIISFMYLKGIDATGDFEKVSARVREFAPVFPRNYSKDKALTAGDFSLIAAQYLRLNNGLLYMASRSPRYATRELIEINIFLINTSEYEKISGINLIRYMQRIYSYAEEKK